MKRRDRKLGMDREITRRDFVHDVSLAAMAAGLPLPALAELNARVPGDPEAAGRYYPPTRTGMRGSHPGSFEVAHALARQGQHDFGPVTDMNDAHDLIVVGGGISGLATAYYYRKLHGPDARILVLDNHDDFGGHAKRNEFHQGGRMQLVWGGTVNFEYKRFSQTVLDLLNELGIDLKRLGESNLGGTRNKEGLKPGTWFDADTYGRDVYINGIALNHADPGEVLPHIDQFPLDEASRESLKKFYGEDTNLLPEMDDTERRRYVHTTSYADFLRHRVGLTEAAIQIFQEGPGGYWGVGSDSLSITEAVWIGMPGLHRLGPDAKSLLADEGDDTSVMFPDGNSSLARILVRSLIPGVADGTSMESIVTADFDYDQLDQAGSKVRIRLNSTAINAVNEAQGVAVTYVTGGKAYRARAKQAVMAGYNMMVPYICPQLPEEQAKALAYAVKRPMLITNVLLRDGMAIRKLNFSSAYCPGRFHSSCFLASGLELGKYQVPWAPDKPTVVQFYTRVAPGVDGLKPKEQHRLARERLLRMSFEDFEREVRTVLDGILGPAGFNAADDILAIIVDRWPHGYAYDYTDLWDPYYAPGMAPNEIGRKRFGNIAIANSDAGADAFTHTAIEQAWRAVNELKEVENA